MLPPESDTQFTGQSSHVATPHFKEEGKHKTLINQKTEEKKNEGNSNNAAHSALQSSRLMAVCIVWPQSSKIYSKNNGH